jgi:hypothetical protein
MANFGYDPTGTGRYGVGVLYNGVGGVNVLADGTLYYGDVNKLVNGKPPTNATAEGSVAQGNQPTNLNLKKPAIAISVPGNIITEDPQGSEESIIEELFENLSLFELMEFGRSDSVLGLNFSYQPIKNLSDIYFTYSPKKILALSGTFGIGDDSSALKLDEYSIDGPITIDPLTGDLLLAVNNVKDGFVVQVEVISGGEIQDS